jgi:hypothetical protein
MFLFLAIIKVIIFIKKIAICLLPFSIALYSFCRVF